MNSQLELTASDEPEVDELLRQAADTSELEPNAPGSALEVGSVLCNGRFEVLRVVGAGGMGVVHEALDRERECRVALKTFLQADPEGIYLLKHEFRALAGVRHPSLIRLHELFCDAVTWFFTMDLVHGDHFDHWVRPNGSLDEARLRSVLPQLVDAVSAVHASDKVHCDLKPSNVLVTREGRLVVLDFGLAVSLDRMRNRDTIRGSVCGTPSYMSPEQANGEPASKASDCYAIGVVLFEALTGKLPFSGELHEVLWDKQTRDAPGPRAFTPTVPPDLDALCTILLSRDPEKRPDAPRLYELLSRGSFDVATDFGIGLTRRPFELVGRDLELDALRNAYRASTEGHPVALFASGDSGIGKSTVLREFLNGLRADNAAIVLEGSCYERESVPFKAFDPLIDDLGNYLDQFPSHELREFVPSDVIALSRLFPVLDRITRKTQHSLRSVPMDKQELRRRAFRAFQDLIRRISQRQPVVISIDDLQWTDADSTAFLVHLLAEADPLRVMFTLFSRGVDGTWPTELQSIHDAAKANRMLGTRRLVIGPLSAEASEVLATDWLGEKKSAEASRLSTEAQGSPFFLQQLCMQIRAGGRSLTLSEVLSEHVGRLSENARTLLTVVATAGTPLRETVALDAAKVSYECIDELRIGHFIRSPVIERGRSIECYHDKIRENVVRSVEPPRLVVIHEQLLAALAQTPDHDLEQLAIHAEGAGKLELAGQYTIAAGDAAHRQLAFSRAVDLYRRALTQTWLSDGERVSVDLKFARALSDAGRGAEAAPIFHRVADLVSPSTALECRRRAAEQWLVSGHAPEGLRAFSEILGAVGLRFPKSPGAALVDLLQTRMLLRLRGLEFRQRTETELPADVLLRIDACKTAWSLSFVSTIRAAAFQSRHLLYALRAGEPYRISIGLCMEAVYVSLSGLKKERDALRLLEAASVLTAGLSTPHAHAFIHLAKGQTSYMLARYDDACDAFASAEQLLAETCSDVTWELNSTRFFWGNALEFRGQLRELQSRIGDWLLDAEARGDLYAGATLGLLRARLLLAKGSMADVRATVAKAMSLWSASEFGVQHFLEVITLAQADLYEGVPDFANKRMHDMLPDFSRSLMSRIQICRIPAHQHAAYAALAMAATSRNKNPWLRKAQAHQRSLLREGTPLASAFAMQIDAAVTYLRGRRELAMHRLASAADLLDRANLHLYAAANRRQLATIGGSPPEDSVARELDVRFTEQGVDDPARFSRMLAPGFD